MLKLKLKYQKTVVDFVWLYSVVKLYTKNWSGSQKQIQADIWGIILGLDYEVEAQINFF